MNTYYSMLGRLIDGKTSIYKQGYYIACEDNTVRFSLEKPAGIEVIYAEEFVKTLVNGCKEIIRTFSEKPENEKVYVFNLFTDEYKTIYVHLNTIPALEKTKSQYPSLEDSLAYNIGDLKYRFWSQHMGKYGETFDQLEKFSDHPVYERSEKMLYPSDQPVIAFEAGIIDSGYYALILEAVKQLHTEQAFTPLNRTDNFIAYASINYDYLDKSLIMRKTISQQLLYTTFPELKDKDLQYAEWSNQFRHTSASEALNKLYDVFISSEYYHEIPYSFYRSPFDVFLPLEHLGNWLADECLTRLEALERVEALESSQFSLIHCYIEAIYFSGELTLEQKQICARLAESFRKKHEDLLQVSRDLIELSV